MRAGARQISCKVAVIGAGAAGLAAAKELLREGHTVTVFEQLPDLGGVWRFDERTELDPLGVDPSRSIVHSSMYRSLRTNLPREVMGYLEFPLHPRTLGAKVRPRVASMRRQHAPQRLLLVCTANSDRGDCC